MNPLERLLALDAIRQLKARRLRAMDAKEWDLYTQLHCADHVSDTYGGEVMPSAAQNTARLREFLDGVTSVHHVFSHELELQSDTDASGIWCMEDRLWWQQETESGPQEFNLHGFGYYHERYRFDDGVWKFCYRRLDRTKVILSPGADMAKRLR